MGRPASDLDDYLEWQQRLENQQASGLQWHYLRAQLVWRDDRL